MGFELAQNASHLLYAWCLRDYLSWFMWRCHVVSGWSAYVTRYRGPRCSIITPGGEDSAASSGLGTRGLRGLEIEGVPPTCCRGLPEELWGAHICMAAFLCWLRSQAFASDAANNFKVQSRSAQSSSCTTFSIFIVLLLIFFCPFNTPSSSLLCITTGTYRSRTLHGLWSSGLKGDVPSGQENRW